MKQWDEAIQAWMCLLTELCSSVSTWAKCTTSLQKTCSVLHEFISVVSKYFFQQQVKKLQLHFIMLAFPPYRKIRLVLCGRAFKQHVLKDLLQRWKNKEHYQDVAALFGRFCASASYLPSGICLPSLSSPTFFCFVYFLLVKIL